VQIGTDSDWKTVVAGFDHNIAIKTDGSLWAWGKNYYGQLGDGTTINKNVPIKIGTDTDWQTIAAGNFQSRAIKTNGTLWAWGNNSGSYGSGDSNNRYAPVAVSSDTDWKLITAGLYWSAALKTNGTLWTSGQNESGQLGNGTSTFSNTYVQVSCTNLGFDDVEANIFSIYPNPVSNKLFFKSPLSKSHQLQVINQLGQQVLLQNSDVSETLLDVSNLSKGIYFLKINTKNGYSQTLKFLKN
jgi:alpha-tubulin suppressor-like RCC1 family protein